MAAAVAPPDSTRSSFLISPSPSPGSSRSPSPSPSFIITDVLSEFPRPCPHKRKRGLDSPLRTPSLTNTDSSLSIQRSGSNSTSNYSGHHSSDSSDVSGIPFLKDAEAGRTSPSASPRRRPAPHLRTKFWDDRARDSLDVNTDAPCIGAGGMPDRAVDMQVRGRRSSDDGEPAILNPEDTHEQWRERVRAASFDAPDTPRSVVSKRMFELGLVDHLERSPSTRSQRLLPSFDGEVDKSIIDEYYDVLGEDDFTPEEPENPMRWHRKTHRYNLKALYSPCPTLTRESIIESVYEDPKLWPTMNTTPVSTSSHSSFKRRRRSRSPPLAPRKVSPVKANPSPPNEPRTIPVPKTSPQLNSGGFNPSKDLPQTRPSSPPLPTPENPNPLTWKTTEITGHIVDTDKGDDGYGIDGIGFKPTKQQEEIRHQRRQRQIEQWRKREDQDARIARFKARAEMKDGLGLIGVTPSSPDRKLVRFVA